MTALEEWDEKRGVKGIDYEAMKEAAKQHAEEEKQEFKGFLQDMNEKRAKKAEALNDLLSKTADMLDEKRRLEMERKQKEETAAAVEEIRAKYEKENPAEWNESPARAALRKMWREMKGNDAL